MDIKVLASGSSGNCYIVSDPQTSLMLECGIKIDRIQRALNYDLSGISTCLVTHLHLDHSLSCKDIYNAGIDIYMGFETSNFLSEKRFLSKILIPGKQTKIGTFIIVPFENHHCNSDGSPCECLGFLIYSTVTQEKLMFSTDTAYISAQFKGLDYIMLEVNYIDEMINANGVEDVEKRRFKSHMGLDTALEFLNTTDLSKTKQIYALHLSKDRCNPEIVLKALRRATGKEIIVC